MTPPTDIRFTITLATSKVAPSALIGEDLTAPREQVERMQKANSLAEQGRLFIHKAVATEQRRDGSMTEKLFQSEPFDSKLNDGRHEYKKLLEMVLAAAVQRAYPPVEPTEKRRVIG